MMYRVIKLFTDLQDSNYKYEVGTEYPRVGYTPTEKRITELASGNNKQKTPLIEEIPEIDEKTADFEDLATLTDETSDKVEKPKRGRKKTNKE